MKSLLLIAFCFATSAVLFAASDKPLPPLVGELPSSGNAPMQFGARQNGMRVGLSSESPTYRVNHRINVWCQFETERPPIETEHALTDHSTSIVKDKFVFVTRPDGTVTKESGSWPIDGQSGSSWLGGMSDQLHRVIRKPGAYKLQWKVGNLESGVVTFTIVSE